MKIVVCSEHIKVNYFIVSNQMMLWLETNDKIKVSTQVLPRNGH